MVPTSAALSLLRDLKFLVLCPDHPIEHPDQALALKFGFQLVRLFLQVVSLKKLPNCADWFLAVGIVHR